MHESLKDILSIQELDIKMIRLMQMKQARKDELTEIANIHKELVEQQADKEDELETINDSCKELEQRAAECTASIKKLESHQSSIKKIDEFNALTKEITLVVPSRANQNNMRAFLCRVWSRITFFSLEIRTFLIRFRLSDKRRNLVTGNGLYLPPVFMLIVFE